MRNIHRNKQYMDIPITFITFDTEAYRYKIENGERQVFAYGYIYNGKFGSYFKNKNEFINFIKQFILERHGIIFIFAHNIIYDLKLIGLLNDIIKGIDPFNMNFKISKFMLDNVVWIEYKHIIKVNNRQITQKVIFLDSYQYLPLPLRQLEKDFLNSDKPITTEEYELEPEKWNKFLDQKGMELVKDDTIKLYEILKIAFNEFRSMNLSFGYSLPNMAFQNFKKLFLKDRELIFPEDKDYIENILQAYRGGFVNVFELGKFDHIVDYDINSLYPYVMKNHKLPIAYEKELHNITLDQYLKLKENHYIIANVDFSLDVDISMIVKRINNKLYSIKSGNVWIHEPEIDYLIENKAQIKFNTVYLYKYSYDLFNEYIDMFYNIKKNSNGNKARKTIAKLFLNSLYGKFGQHKSHTEYIPLNDNEIMDLQEPIRMIEIEPDGKRIITTNYGEFLTRKKEEKVSYAPEIAGSITAYARMKLYEYIKKAGFENVVYCDTDSIHCKGHYLDQYISEDLGMLKIEKEGSGEYLAPKFYQINNEWTTKGISKKDILLQKDENKQIWLSKRFEKVKTINKNGVIVRNVIKTLKFENDKFKWIGKRGYSFEEKEILEKKKEKIKKMEKDILQDQQDNLLNKL